MKDKEQETIYYTIEREFLSEITTIELVNRIIQQHIKKQLEKETDSL